MLLASAPLSPAEEVDTPRAVLRDGTVATVRVVTIQDGEAIERFFLDLSPESRRRRFLAMGTPQEAFLDQLCEQAGA